MIVVLLKGKDYLKEKNPGKQLLHMSDGAGEIKIDILQFRTAINKIIEAIKEIQ